MREKKKLIIITRGYPVNDEELSFLVPELDIIKETFDIILLPKFINRLDDYLTKEYEVVECNCKLKRNKLLKYAMISLLDLRLWKEIRIFLKRKVLNVSIIRQILTDVIMSKKLDDKLNKIIKECNNDNKIIIYSYWYDYGLLSALKAVKRNKNIKVITRAHGFDLYNERCKTGYQCFKEQIDKKIDKVIFISEYGKEYYQNTFCKDSDESKYLVGYLGTSKQNFIPYQKQEEMCILTCSSVIPLKRLDIIIQALAQINEFKINWIHIGTGSNLDAIKDLAKSKLDKKENIAYKFEGYLNIDSVMDYYKDHYFDCFILISDTEGLPFSIMEAMSFGIPVIANNVGGINEIVNENNGYLLAPKPDANKLTSHISKQYYMTDKDKVRLRNEAYFTWQSKFDSMKNATEFMNMLDAL